MNLLVSIQAFIIDLLQTFATFGKILIGSGHFIRPANYPGKDNCIILGNGPSLLESISLNKNNLDHYQLIAVNYFAESDIYQRIKPHIYILSAPEMWMEDVESDPYEKAEKLFQTLSTSTDWSLNLFIPYPARKFERWKKIIKQNPKIKINYFNTTPVEGFKWFRYICYNHYLGMPRPHNVLIPSLMIALSLNFKKIYLFGTDHSWMKDMWVTEENVVLLRQKHFYDADKAKARAMKYLGKGRRKMHEVLQKFVYAFRGYIEINEYSISKGKEIINCTKGSYIDAFKRSSKVD
jgi:hypothetical protein